MAARPGEALYFAFGSNMHEPQMLTRCPSARRVTWGWIDGFDLVFNHPGSYRPGGVASIEPYPGRRVLGVVWALGLEDLEGLDAIERAYQREEHEVRTACRAIHRCHLYRTSPKGDFHPDVDYVELLHRGAVAAGMPRSWSERLRTLRWRAHELRLRLPGVSAAQR